MKIVSRFAFAPSLIIIAVMVVRGAPQSRNASANPPANDVSKRDEAARLNNLGAAYMNQQAFEKALGYFKQAYAADPQMKAARLNQAIALLNLQRTDDAKTILQEITKQDSQSAHAWYNLGLLYKGAGDSKAALDAFERAVELAPNDPDAYYFVGLMFSQLNQPTDAIPAFQHALKLNQYHASAEFGLARAYQKAGQAEQARAHLTTFQHLTQTKLGAPITLAYGDQGPLSMVVMTPTKAEAVAPAISVKFVDVTEQAGLAGKSGADHDSGACFFDYDNDGKPDLFVAGGGKQGGVALYHNIGNGRFEDVTKAAGLNPAESAIACAASDYDNDNFTDLAISYPDHLALLHNEHNGTFKNVADNTGVKAERPGSLLWFDYDHDGDTDLYVMPRGVGGRIYLWRNNGNSTFTEVGEATGLGNPETLSAAPMPWTAATASDINNDRAIDVAVLGGDYTQIVLNPREGKWQPANLWSGDGPRGSTSVAIFDFNKDGWMDAAFTHPRAPGLSLWRNGNGTKFEPVALPDLHWTRAYGLAALDYDNDGWIDLVAVGETTDGKGEIRLLRNMGAQGFKDVTADVGLDKIALKSPRGVIAVDYDGNGDADVLITQSGGAPVLLRNDGGNANNSLRIALKGLNDNKSAIGTKVEVFAGTSTQKFELMGSSYLGQSSTAIIAGLGKNKQADVVRMLWPTGVVQDEIEVASAKPVNVVEIDRRGSSCPTLFAWDGKKYRFISDMIGAGVVGHWVGENERNTPDPTEYQKVDGSVVKLRNGRLSFRFMEPMEEVVYVDQLRLLAIDHPANYVVNPNEYFASNPPFPDFKVISSRQSDLRLPAGAWDDKGRDVLPQLRSIDHQYVTGFKLLKGYAGYAEPHSLTLDLGEPYRGGTLRLLLHGFIEYFSASSMYSAHQAKIEPVAPYVEAQRADGSWVRIVDDMGFPAGLPRTTVADLTGKLLIGTQKIRISTNLQIYWDQILVDRTPQPARVQVTEVPLAAAKLAFHGYPRDLLRNNFGDHYYVYEDVSSTGPYAREAGAYTRFGDVRDLLTKSDDKFVVFGSGDEIQVDFNPSALPALPRGWKRDYLFFADGYEKDMDFYAADFLTVDPLPFHAMGGYPYGPEKQYPADADHVNYLLQYNDRFYSGKDQAHYRYSFRSSPKQAGD